MSAKHSRIPPALLYAAAGIAGAAGLAMELIAGRMLAPFYGQSTVVWAGVISAVLLNMAAGSLMGGRIADRCGPGRRVYGFIPVASALASTLLAIPCYYALKAAFAGGTPSFPAFILLLFAALEIFSLPVMGTAAMVPVITGTLTAGREDTYSVLGRALAAGTAGSVIGAALAALILIPLAGVVWGLFTVNLLLLFSGAPFIFRGTGNRGRWPAILFLAAASLLLLSAPAWRLLDAQVREGQVIAAFDTPYNYVRVLATPDGPMLAVNDPYFIQSVSAAGPPRLDAWHLYLLGPAMVSGNGVGRALFLGYGAGSAATLYRKYYPALELAGIEIDPAIVKAGKDYLGDTSGAAVIIGDARTELGRLNGTFDVIVSDVFRFPYMPHHTVTVEFFRLVKNKLAPGGVLVVNAGRYDDDDAVARGVAASLSLVFTSVRLLPLGRFNTLIFAGEGSPAPHFNEEGLKMLSDYFMTNVHTYKRKTQDAPFRDDVPVSEYLTNIMGLRFLGSEEYR